MTHKMAAAEALPPAAKPHKAEEIQKESNLEDPWKNAPQAKTEEFGYAVPNQR